ncbi:MAG: Gfo/Idh/MocA family oxidoreductase [Humidesulfovibrio sp.]|uniref:Gfo/Idh/MocA family oxidoreductase n=1 Tax=Humidesulfovibrio sp. TaxID=2910988 RepID=UPI0027348814|nr:Gfo/Idh/MocA family oxidoreductase [Humidesulfovibrio sp.]MDP2849427.1 Gfo/Idh/MocA family oxidoreductase [Humidesulfovibrio sp.]
MTAAVSAPPKAEPLRIGLIGAGFVARQHLMALARVPELVPVGIASRTREKAQSLADEFGLPLVADSPAELVETARPDALMVLVSPQAMAPLTLECLGFGLPLFLEKPVGLSVAEAEDVAKAARAASARAMVGFNRRHYSVFGKGVAKIRERGRLLAVHIEGSERMAVARGTGRFSDAVLRAWLFANATHTIDLLRHFGGEPEVAHALCASLHEPLGDQFAACLRFPGGVLGSYTANWHSPGGWGVILKGEGVSVEFRPLETGRVTYADGTSEVIEPDADEAGLKAGFVGQLRAFADLVRTGVLAPPSLDLEGALLTMRLAGKLAAAPASLD